MRRTQLRPLPRSAAVPPSRVDLIVGSPSSRAPRHEGPARSSPLGDTIPTIPVVDFIAAYSGSSGRAGGRAMMSTCLRRHATRASVAGRRRLVHGKKLIAIRAAGIGGSHTYSCSTTSRQRHTHSTRPHAGPRRAPGIIHAPARAAREGCCSLLMRRIAAQQLHIEKERREPETLGVSDARGTCRVCGEI